MTSLPPSPRRARAGTGRGGTGRAAAALAVAAFGAAACSLQGPPLAGFDGLQHEAVSFYRDNAAERGFACVRVTMTPVRAEIVEETADRVTLNVGYRWSSDRQARGSSPGPANCNGSGERTFTFARNASGRLVAVDMTGERRP